MLLRPATGFALRSLAGAIPCRGFGGAIPCRRFGGAIALVAALGACAGDKPKALHVITDPGQMFVDDLEGRMLRARTVRLDAVLLASGAVNASLSARLVLGDGQRARLDVEGTFEGRPVKTWFECDGTKMQVRSAASAPCAAEVRDALVIGFVRMGLLHNAALVIAGDPPDHAAGNAHNWVRAERARSGTPATEIAFDIVVKRDVVGTAVLTLDNAARPIKRTQRVQFSTLEGDGEMNVVESYPRFELDVDVTDVFPAASPSDAGPDDVTDAGPNAPGPGGVVDAGWHV